VVQPFGTIFSGLDLRSSGTCAGEPSADGLSCSCPASTGVEPCEWTPGSRLAKPSGSDTWRAAGRGDHELGDRATRKTASVRHRPARRVSLIDLGCCPVAAARPRRAASQGRPRQQPVCLGQRLRRPDRRGCRPGGEDCCEHRLSKPMTSHPCACQGGRRGRSGSLASGRDGWNKQRRRLSTHPCTNLMQKALPLFEKGPLGLVGQRQNPADQRLRGVREGLVPA
jgi:hypothetical protein